MSKATLDAGAPSIVATQLKKWYGPNQVLHDVDVTIKQGERVVVCGPSGEASRLWFVASTGCSPTSSAA